jgi:hypothetical protein
MKYLISFFLTLLTIAGYGVLTAQNVQRDILFTWDAAVCAVPCVKGVDGYRLYTEAGNLVADILGEGTSFILSDFYLTPNVEQSFYITAYNEDGEAVPSNLASVMVEGAPPSSTILRVVLD